MMLVSITRKVCLKGLIVILLISLFSVIVHATPSVNIVYPTGQTINISDSIDVNATVTDGDGVDDVFANVSYPNGTKEQLTLTNPSGNTYTVSFTVPQTIGQFNITLIANDTLGNVNNGEITSFVSDLKNPRSVTNLRAWYDAVDNTTLYTDTGCSTAVSSEGQDINCWGDKSDYLANATMVSGKGVPIFAPGQFNGNSVVNFSKSDEDTLRHVLSSQYTSDFTLFIVIQSQDASPAEFDAFFSNGEPSGSDHFQIDYNGAGSFRANGLGGMFFEGFSTDINLFGIHQDSGTSTAYSEGSIVNTTTNSDGRIFEHYRINQNRQGNAHHNSFIGEIVIYDRALSACEIEKVNNYLGPKYGRDFSGIDDRYEHSSNFPNDINGIGIFLPSECSPVPLLSEAVSDFLTIRNPNSVDQNDTLTFGHDNGNLTVVSEAPSSYHRVQQEWRADIDDAVGGEDDGVGNVTVSFDLSDNVSLLNYDNFVLLTDSDGDFSDANVISVLGVVSNNIVTFSNVSFSDGDYFTLGFNDTTPPNVTSVIPASDSNVSTNIFIEIGVNVTDNIGVDSVLANVTTPNGTKEQLVLAKNGNKYNGSYSVPILFGTFTILFIANDTSGNVNSSVTTTFSTSFADPNSLSGIQLWYDSTDNTTLFTDSSCSTPVSSDYQEILCWEDKADGDNNATVVTGKYGARYRSASSELINSLTTLRFNKSNESVYETGFDIRATTSENVTSFSVYRPRTTNTSDQGQGLWGNDNGAWDRFFYSLFAQNGGLGTDGIDDGLISLGGASNGLSIDGAGIVDEIFLLTAVYNGNTSSGSNVGPPDGSQIYFDGVLQVNFTDESHITAAQTQLYLGWDGDNGHYDGDYAETIVYDRLLTVCEIELVNNYLGNKYGKDFNRISTNYEFSAPYTYDINGIGVPESVCDPASAIASAQSDVLTVSSATDAEEGDLVTFGHDNGNLTVVSEAPSSYHRVQQEWRVDVDNTPGNVTISFDLSENTTLLGYDHFVLFIDNDGDFSDATVVNITGIVSGNSISFSNVSFSNGDYFTLGFNDTSVPSVFALVPEENTNFTILSTITVAANVTDSVFVDTVLANITLPNSSFDLITLSLESGNKYSASYSLSNLTGQYNVTYIANDTSGNVNASETTFFIGNAFLTPQIYFVEPTPSSGASINTDSFVINISSSNDDGDHYTFVDYQEALFGWYRFDDENSSGEVSPVDLSSHSNNGSLENGAFINDSGRFGSAVQFDGTDDYVLLPNSAISFAEGLSICAWVYWDSFDESWARIVDFGQGQADDNILFAHRGTSTELVFEVYSGGSGGGQISATGVLIANTWQHLCATLNSSGNVSIYVDGVIVQNGSTSVPATVTRDQMYIGRSAWSGDGYFDGAMDEFLLFNRSLQESEVASIFNATATQYQTNFSITSDGNVSFTGYAVSVHGKKNQTELRTIISDTAVPQVVIDSPISGLEVDLYRQVEVAANVTDMSVDAVRANITLPNGTVRQFMLSNEEGNKYNISFNETPVVGTYYVRFIANDSSGNVNSSETTFFRTEDGIAPGGVNQNNNLRMWLRADRGVTTNSTSITNWHDQIPMNNFSVYGDAPIVNNSVNFNPAITFDGDDDFLHGNTSFLFREVFIVTDPTDSGVALGANESIPASTQQYYFRFISNKVYIGDDGPDYIHSIADAPFSRMAIYNNEMVEGSQGTESRIAFDGEDQSVNSISGNDPLEPFVSSPRIARGTDSNPGSEAYYEGSIAEVIVYNESLTTNQRTRIVSYLAIKYGITLDEALNYTDSQNATVYPSTTTHSSYVYDIAGIGSDNVSRLNQTRSQSINNDSVLQIFNATSLDDGDFLLWGNDNVTTAETQSNTPSTVGTRLSRIWRIYQTGNVGNVSVLFNLSGLSITGSSADEFHLMIDDVDTDFSSGATLIAATSFSDDIVRFGSVNFSESDSVALGTSNDATPPSVINVSATPNGTSRINETIFISANVSDNVAVDTVLANITLPNGSVDQLNLTLSTGDMYNSSYTASGVFGTYTIRIIANDTFGNVNDSETTVFSVINNRTPSIYFVSTPTPLDASLVNQDNIIVNVSSDSFDNDDHYTFVDFGDSLVFWMRMDDLNESGHPIDISGYGNNGTMVGSPVINSTGVYGDAIHLDGINDFINVSDSSSLQLGAGDLTVAAWFNLRGYRSDDQQIVVKRASGSGDYEIQVEDDKKITVYLNEGGGPTTNLRSSFDVSLNTWYHTVMVNRDGNFTLYVNGVVEDNASFVGNTDSSAPLQIGNDPAKPTEFFNGSIDEVLIFNRSFTPNEVLSLYNATKYQYQNNFTNLTEGNHTFIGYAASTNGRKNQTEQRMVTIDTIPPSVILDSPLVNSEFDINTMVEVAANVSDALGVDTVLVNVTLPNGTTRQFSLSNEEQNKYNISFNETSVIGQYSILFIANDTSGNINDSETTFLTIIDNRTPGISFVTPPTPANGSTINVNHFVINVSSDSFENNDHYMFVDRNNTLTLWMRFDDVNGSGDPTDISSKGNNGSLSGDALINATGRFGDALQLDGSGDFVNLPASNVLIPNGDVSWTMTAWFNAESIGSSDFANRIITVRNGPGLSAISFTLGDSDKLQFFYRDGGGSGTTTDIRTISTDRWYHYAVTYNESDFLIYVDGILNATITDSMASTSSDTARIGANPGGSSEFFNGSIDEILLFDRPFTASDILSLYNASANQYQSNFTNLEDGNHSFIGYAVSTNGKRNQTELRTLAIDTIPPSVTGLIPSPDMSFDINTNIEIAANVTDAVGVDTVFANVRYPNGSVEGITLSNDVESVYNVSFTIPLAGFYNITFVANDTAGNVNGSEYTNVTSLQVSYPGGVSPTLTLWLDANKNDTLFQDSCGGTSASHNDVVGCWEDRSGNNNDVIASSTERPSLQAQASKQINFNPALDFDGSNDFLEDADGENYINGVSAFSTFVVVDSTSASADRYIFNSESETTNAESPWGLRFDDAGALSGADNTLKTGINTGSPELYEGNEDNIASADPMLASVHWASGQAPTLFVNGRSIAVHPTDTKSGTLSSANYVRIGHEAGHDFWSGGIAELVYYQSRLNTTAQYKVASYLAIKYGVTLDSSQNYVDSDNDTIYASQTSHENYTSDIAGIGVDGASGLDQVRSQSVNSDSVVQMYNASSLSEGEFLVWGNNNDSLTEINENKPIGILTRINRTWRVDTTGTVGSVTVLFNLSGLSISGSSVSDFYLLIDSDENFTNASTFEAAGFVDSVVRFDEVSFSDNDFFSITTLNDTIPPNVSSVVASPTPTFNLTARIDINATVSDATEVDIVFANVTLPDSSVQQFNLSLLTGTIYNFSYTLSSQIGTYTVRIIANDTLGYVNSSETTTFELQNGLPQASAATVNEGSDITLSEGTNTSVIGTATITDANGFGHITSVTGHLFETTQGIDGDDNRSDHYTETCVSNNDGNENAMSYNCTFNVSHYAVPTDSSANLSITNWTFAIVPSDSIGVGSNATDITEVNTLLAFTINPTIINFGELDLGTNTTTSNQEINVTNLGNVGLDVVLSGTNLSCNTGLVPVDFLEYEDNPFEYGVGTDLLESGVELDLDAHVGYQGNESPLRITYYGLGVPDVSVGGACTGSVVITGQADPGRD